MAHASSRGERDFGILQVVLRMREPSSTGRVIVRARLVAIAASNPVSTMSVRSGPTSAQTK
jgi:hypothetical protein